MKHIRNLIIDMDGVLWHGNAPMAGLDDFFAALRQLDINVALATNNASQTAVSYQQKLAGFGVEMDVAHIFTSALATASFVRRRHEGETAVYVVGEVGLREAIAAQGFHLLTAEEVMAGAIAVVVTVGFSQKVTYAELAAASILIRKGAAFVGANPDVTFPSEYGLLPGNGSLLAFVQAATGVTPTIIGKPGPALFEEAMAQLGATRTNTAMIGDRLNTDIAGGIAAGIETILVMSGITQPDDLEQSDIQPDYIFADIGALAAELLRVA